MAKTLNNKNLNNIVTGTAKQWAGQVATYQNNKRGIKRAQHFALDLMDYLEEKKISQKELATLMDVSPQQVNKILRAKANLTFDTIDKIAEALGVTISSPTIIAVKPMHSQTRNTMQIVHKRKQKVIEEDASFPPTTKRNPVLQTTLSSVEEYQFTAEQI